MIVAARAMSKGYHDEAEYLTADTCLSLETQADMMAEHIGTYIRENFEDFIRHLRLLPPEDQEILLAYYLLNRPQWCIAKLYRSTQTVCSSKLRMAVKKLGSVVLFGVPTVEDMDPILSPRGLNELVKGVSTAMMIDEYRNVHSFTLVAKKFRVHRPDVRRALSHTAKTLLAQDTDKELALGAYLHGLIDKASSSGQGYNQRKLDKYTHVLRRDPGVLGSFRISITDPDFEHVLVSKASY
jgi:hypothetical protein